MQALAYAPGRITLLVGDSGVGKSVVLEAAQSLRIDAVAPSPVQVRHAPAGLQRALLDGLGAAAAELAAGEGDARQLGSMVVDACRRLGRARLDNMGAAVGKFLLGLVRARLGDAAADAIGEFADEISHSFDERLSARITAAANQDVIDTVIALAAELVQFAEDRQVLLAVDDADRLTEDDRRRIADLIETLPEGLAVRMAFSTWDISRRQWVDELGAAGVATLELPGLDVPAVGRWLASADLSEDYALTVHRVTDGYGLHVADAVALLQAGGSIADLGNLTLNGVLGSRTSMAWRQLDNHSQLAATRLSIFQDPPPTAVVSDLLELRVDEWGVLRRRLRDAGIFAGEKSWFHELRRRYVWNHLLREDERQAAAERARAPVLSELENRVEPAMAVTFARIAREDGRLLDSDREIGAAVAASSDEMAISAALIELVEPRPGGQVAISADALLRHAREAFTAQGDLESALRRLADRGLVQVETNRDQAVVAAAWQSNDVWFVLAGRASDELGRMPLPHLASALFEGTLRRELGPFRIASYGIGKPSVRAMAANAVGLQREQSDGTIVIGRKGPNLLVRARHGDTPVWATVVYTSDDERDRADSRLSGLNRPVWGRKLRVCDVIAHPTLPVPSRRFLQAAELLTGERLGTASGSRSSATLKRETPLPLEEEMARRAAILTVVRDLCSPEERLALGLDEPVGVLYDGDMQHNVLIEIHGRPGAHRVAGLARTRVRDPFGWIIDSHLANLTVGESLEHKVVREGTRDEDPVVDMLGALHNRAAEYNRSQQRLKVSLKEDTLAHALTAAAERSAGDAAAIAAAVPVGETSQVIGGSRTYVILQLDEPREGWVPASHATLLCTRMPNPSDTHEAKVHVLAPTPHSAEQVEDSAFINQRTTLAVTFDLDPERITWWSDGDARAGLAGLLGHTSDELDLVYPAAEPTDL